MKILITGGTGFLGGHVAKRLSGMGHEVTVTGRKEMPLGDAALVAKFCAGKDQVVHCAGLASPWGDYSVFHEANVVGTRNVLDGCRKAKVARIVHLSTPSLYFDYKNRRGIKESDPLPRPVTAYAATKLLADQAVEQSDVPWVSLRPRAIFGPGDRNVLPRLLGAVKRGKLPLVGGGRTYVDLSYVDNVVDAVLLSMAARGDTLGRHYNITNGEPLPLRAIVDKVTRALQLDVKVRPIPYSFAYTLACALETYHRLAKPDVEPKLTRYGVGLMGHDQTLDITEARTRLGYEPKVSLDEGLARFASWWQEKTKETA